MAVRIRQNGSVVCAAKYPELRGDIYLDDGLHYLLSVEAGVLVALPNEKWDWVTGYIKSVKTERNADFWRVNEILKIANGRNKSRYFSCKRKRPYRISGDAFAALEGLKNNIDDKIERDSLRVYQCRFCNLLHIGKDRHFIKRSVKMANVQEVMKNIKSKLTKEERESLGIFISSLINKRYLPVKEGAE